MKKFSKILFLLLSVIAILTAFTVVTLAAETLDPSGSYNVADGWEGKADGTFIGVAAARRGNILSAVADNGNYYTVYEPKNDDGTTTASNFLEPGLSTAMNADKTFKYNVKDYPYMMFDFDIMTPTGTLHTSPTFNFRFQHTKARDGKSTYVNFTSGFGVSAFSAYIDSTPYNWQHVSVIMEYAFETDAESGVTTKGTVKHHYFINGVFAFSSSAATVSYFKDYLPEDIGHTTMRLNASPGTSTTAKVAFDNFYVSYFTANYGELADMVATVYNEDYERPYTSTVATIVRGTVDNPETLYFDSFEEAINAANDGETVYVKADSEEAIIVDKPIKVDRNVYDEDGVATGEYYNINCSSSTLVPTEENGVFTFAELQNAQVEIYWDDCPALVDENEESDECYCEAPFAGHIMAAYTESAMLNTVPVYPGEIPTFDIVDGLEIRFVGWSYTQGGEAEELKAITQEDCDNLSLSLYPVYEVIQYAFEVTAPNGDVTYFAEDQFYMAVNSAVAGSTVKFLTDVTTASGATVSKDITVDLNGKTLKRTNVSAIQYNAVDNGDGTYGQGSVITWGTKPSVFYVSGTDIDFTITSSQPGAVIYNGTLMATNDYYLNGEIVKQTVKGTMMGGQLISNGSLTNCTFNIYGENLEFFGSEVVDLDNGNVKGTKVNLDGGIYNRIVADYSALITMRNGSGLNFKNATFVTNGGTALYVWASKATNETSQPIVFENCDFVSGDFYTNDPASVTFNNCRIANPTVTNGGGGSAFVFGENTALGAALGANTVVAAGFEALEYVSNKTYSVATLNAFKLNADKTLILDSTYDYERKDVTVNYTYMVLDPNGTFATVYWVDAEGNVFDTTKVIKNGTAVPPTTASVPTGDGYRNVIINRWTNELGVEDYVIGEADEYTFTAAPAQEGDSVTYVANITDAMMNLTYYAQFHIIFYLPYNENFTELPTVSGTSGAPSKLESTVLIDGVRYWAYAQYCTTTTVLNDNVKTVTFTLDGVQYTQKFNASGLVYSQIVLSDNTATDLEQCAVANMVRFVRESLEAYGSSDAALYNKINALIGSEDGTVAGLYDLPEYIADNAYPDYELDAADLSDYIYSIHFQMRGAYAAYVFTKTDKAVAEGATIAVSSANGGWGIRDNTATSTAPWTLNLKVYDAIDTMTITVKVPAQYDAEGTLTAEAKTLTAEYSIGAYINATDSDLARALYAFGAAAKDYRNNRKDY